MKNILPLILLTALIFFSCSKTKSGDILTFPKDWQVQHDYMGCLIMGLSPLENEYDQFRENGNAVMEKLPGSMTYDEYTNANLETMKRVMTNFVVIETSDDEVNGFECKKIVYTHTMGQLDIKVLSYFLVDGKEGYVLTFSASPEQYEKYLPEFKRIAGSINL